MKLKKDQKSSIFWLLVAGFFLVHSFKASIGSLSNPGTGLLPFIAALAFGVFSLINLIVASIGKGVEKEKPIFPPSETNWKNLIVTCGALFAFPFLLSLLGFILTVFGFTLFLSKAIEPRKWIKAVLFAGAVTCFCYLLFVHFLKLFMDKGIFGI